MRIALLMFVAMIGGCSDTCENELISTADAPTGDLKAVLFQRDCGATTGFSSQVSLTKSDGAPYGAGNVFVADADHGRANAASWGGPWVELHWLSPQHLLVRYDANARVFKNNESVSGVRISYEKVGR